MPTYDYVCDSCEHAFEELQSMLEKVLVECPKCKKPSLRRLIGAGAGIIFKGSGFYKTDYRKSDAGSDSSPPPSTSAPSTGSPATPDKSCGSCGKTGPNVCD